VFEGVAAAARYPDGGANEDDDYPSLSNGTSSSSLAATSGLAGGSSSSGVARMSDAAYQAAREEQDEVEEQRKELLSLFRNTAKLAFPEALQFAASKLQAVLASAGAMPGATATSLANGLCGSPPALGSSKLGAAGSSDSSKFQDTELAVTLVYELGEGAPEETLKPGSGGLAQLVMLLLGQAASLPAGQHRLVALAVLETCVRYCKLLQQHQDTIPAVCGLFLGSKGLGHPSPSVAIRAAYLLSRFVKTLRGNLRQYAGNIMQQLQPYLEVVATRPPPSSTAAVGTNRETAGGRAPAAAVIDDRLYVFESLGLLLGQEELPPDQQLAALQQLLMPLTRQIETNLGPAAAEAAAGSSSGSSSWAIMQSLEAIARLNKGFKWELCTRSRPQIGEWLV
jgi:exportin-T